MKMIDVMKRLSELDLDNPNIVKENQNLPVATPATRREYDLETTITNPAYAAWENGVGDENSPPSETIEVGINYVLDSDQDYNGRNFPVIDKSEVYDLATGQELNISDENVLDSIEQAIWKAVKQDRDDDHYEDMSNQGNMGAHGEETTSPIHGGQRKEKTMENLNLESLRYLAGVKDTIAESGIGSGMPASINITAGSGQELTGMLKDIMNLAGVSKVEPHHMPVDRADAGPSTVISAPPMAGAMRDRTDPNVEMHKLMAIVGEPDRDQDSMNSKKLEGDEEAEEGLMGGLVGGAIGATAGGPMGAAAGYSAGSKMGDDLKSEDNDRMYDSSPDEKVMGDPMSQFGDINSGDHRQRQAGLPIAKPMETTFKQLMADYEQFIAEGKVVYDKKTASMKSDTTDSDQRHGLYINGKLVKTCNTKDEASNTKKRDPKFKTATIKKIAEGSTMKANGPSEVDVPAALRKQKRPGQDTAQSATDKRNASSGAKVWSSKRTSEGAVKQIDADIKDKTMNDADFKKKYGMSKADAKKELSTPKKK